MLFISALVLSLFSAATNAAVSTDGRCGPDFKQATCKLSRYGDCCSQYGYCGNTKDHCDATTCQKNFGICNAAPTRLISISRTSSSPSASTPSTAVVACSTTTVTVTQPAACPTDAITNSGFSSLTGWTIATAGDGEISLGNAGPGAAGGGFVGFKSSKETQRLFQAITVCPGAKYQVSFKARRISGSGTVTAKLYVNDVAYAGGEVTNTAAAFLVVGSIGGGVFTALAGENSALVWLEIGFSDEEGLKEAQIDGVQVVKLE